MSDALSFIAFKNISLTIDIRNPSSFFSQYESIFKSEFTEFLTVFKSFLFEEPNKSSTFRFFQVVGLFLTTHFLKSSQISIKTYNKLYSIILTYLIYGNKKTSLTNLFFYKSFFSIIEIAIFISK